MSNILVKPQFQFLYQDPTPNKVIVCCRGGGKTWAVCDWLVHELVTSTTKNSTAIFFAPTLRQVRETIEPIMRRHQDIWGEALVYNLSQMTYKFKIAPDDKREIMLLSYENEDTKRGLHPDFIACDEIANMSASMLNKVVMPMLVPAMERGTGKFVAIGTPQGRNLFHKLFLRGESCDCPDWSSYQLKASTSGLVSAETQWTLRNNMTGAEYEQEMEASFDANVLVGSVYGQYLDKFTCKNTDDTYGYNPSLPVWTAWDLGHSNNTAIWFFQVKNDQITFVDFYENNGYDVSHYAGELLSRPYVYEKAILPWDAGAKNIRSPVTISDMLTQYGIKNVVLPNTSIKAGIDESRMLLKTCRFNKTKCNSGLIHLRSYRFKIDDKTGVDKQHTIHDEHSDAADAFRYAAVGKYIYNSHKKYGKINMIERNYNVLSSDF